MKKKKEKKVDLREKIKVQLDSKTIVFVHTMKAFQMWLERFPNAKIVTN